MSEKYAVIDGGIVVNLCVADKDFAQAQGWILAPDNVGIGWGYSDGEFVPPVPTPPTPEEIMEQNKSTAASLLARTDWTCTVDINNPQYSNPYLGNQEAFLEYRSQVRAIAVNPPTTPAVFPEVPQEVWISV